MKFIPMEKSIITPQNVLLLNISSDKSDSICVEGGGTLKLFIRLPYCKISNFPAIMFSAESKFEIIFSIELKFIFTQRQ